jgi:hypothetical protein
MNNELTLAMIRLQNLIESKEAYDGASALAMLDEVYRQVRLHTKSLPLSERYPELVGKVVGGGNRKENIE